MFQLREQLITDFAEYIQSFLKVRDERIREWVEAELDGGALWPEPLLGLNPTFEPGRLVDELVADRVLHDRCGTIFRRGKCEENPSGQPLRLFCHQEEAIQHAQAGDNYVLTTGTGSGKSLSYILPIVDTVLKEGSGRGIRAVVVYPMNALANSQRGELEKYLGAMDTHPPVTYARYTGQESQEERDRITQSPPDILLTNYMMLELILSRPYEKALVAAMGGLRFVVLDELHTYRGRQGADVALLMRRLRQRSRSPRVQYVGTSATMATEGTAFQRREAVAEVASRLFGATVLPASVIGESLIRWSPEANLDDLSFVNSLREALAQPSPTEREPFRVHPLTVWLETTTGLRSDDEGRLVRAAPSSLYGPQGAAERLAQYTGMAPKQAEEAIERHLLAVGELEPDPRTGNRPFVFRLHQFFSPGVGVFSTLADGPDRFLSLDGQKTDPKDPQRILFPLAFCRVCGQHYYLTSKTRTEHGDDVFVPRRLTEVQHDETTTAGFLYVPEEQRFPEVEALLPDDWYEEHHGSRRLKRTRRTFVPQDVHVGPDGRVGGQQPAWFIQAPFCLCVNPECGASYGPRESDITKLSVLGLQGRSTATTTLSLSALSYLRKQSDLPPHARKLLSFTDNRQDASLQSGHLNDFVEVGLLRAAIYAAAEQAGEDGVSHDQITLAIERQLGLAQEEFAQQPSSLPTQVEQRRKALRDVLGYRAYRDLRRGWRINAPNLEQVGLLKIEYPDLPYVCTDESRWNGCHEVLVRATPEVRERLCRELLERMRRKLAIHVDYLKSDYQESIRRRSSQLLKEPWCLSEDEALRLDTGSYAWLNSAGGSDERSDLFLTPKSAFAIYLRQPSTLPHVDKRLSMDDSGKVIEDLVQVLVDAALIAEVRPNRKDVAYQLNAETFVWKAIEPGREHRRTHNSFFERFYRERAAHLRGIHAREHTAQVVARERERREELFREGTLPILFCSPTMELGVDIADLNVVNMRNVPPTPANYAQRSGRAGRSGQPALVYTYCTAGSPHDQYYFRRPEHMVSGAVTPPRLDVANEDLVRAHVHAIWLGEADLDLGRSLADKLLDVSGDNPSLELREEIKDKLYSSIVRDRARHRARAMLDAIRGDLERTTWYADRWLDDVIDQVPLTFDRACDRWRNLYRSALNQAKAQDLIIRDASSGSEVRRQAERLRREAEQQLELLRDASSESLSDFYTYRYLASEGFLPGYNFPRLPLSAYLPGLRGKDEYLSRPRFLAISEFGPGAVIYHEGSRYLVDRVLTPASSRQDGGKLLTSTAKLCAACGYLHEGAEAQTADVCERCEQPLTQETEVENLFRLDAVSLRRKDRITCDEEERMRQGYELRTAIRFKGRAGDEQCVRADVIGEHGAVASMLFAQAATLWRINVGWNRRKEKGLLGYQLDIDRGKWLSEDGANALMQEDADTNAQRVQRVVPYVEDRRNALLFEWPTQLLPEQHASLQAALKTAIQSVFQLEDSELAAEPLPSTDLRRSILFYEAAEGGAGVLRRLVDDPHQLRHVARQALQLCHFDPDTLEDQHRHPRAKEDCSTACYDCLMSYANQRDHLLLDRREIADLLAALRDARVEAASGTESRSAKLERLLGVCDSELERSWLKLLDERGLSLPTYAQYRIPECGTKPDFAYVHGASKLAVYIDGPPHDYPGRQLRDADQDMLLMSKGWLVQRFHHTQDWERAFEEFPSIYGGGE